MKLLGDGVGAGLTSAEISALATVVVGPVVARHILTEAGFPAGRIPMGTPDMLTFWASVSEELVNGVLVDGRHKLFSVLKHRYPDNRTFGATSSRTFASVDAGVTDVAGSEVEVSELAFDSRDAIRERRNREIVEVLSSGEGVIDCTVWQLDDHTDDGFLLHVKFDPAATHAALVLKKIREAFQGLEPYVPYHGQKATESSDAVSFAYTYFDKYNKYS